MHGIEYQASGSGSLTLFDITFKVDEDVIKIRIGSLIKLIKELNVLFSKIVDEIATYAYQNKLNEYQLYSRLTRFNFKDFNLIYNSEILRIIGLLSNEF